jgi:hypothetical protein
MRRIRWGIGLGLVLALSLLGRAELWAAPGLSPARQTVPTRTPVRSSPTPAPPPAPTEPPPTSPPGPEATLSPTSGPSPTPTRMGHTGTPSLVPARTPTPALSEGESQGPAAPTAIPPSPTPTRPSLPAPPTPTASPSPEPSPTRAPSALSPAAGGGFGGISPWACLGVGLIGAGVLILVRGRPRRGG